MEQSTVHQHPASIDAYIRHGWSLVPIPAGTKGPRTRGWNLRENALTAQGDLPSGFGIGLAHAYSGTMALDIDDWDLATVALSQAGIDLHGLYHAPDAVQIHSGRAGHGKLLYAMPFGLTLASKKIRIEGRTAYELRNSTHDGIVTVQDVLPPSIHPDTGQPYRWGGLGNWMRLPVLPIPIMDHWQKLIQVESVHDTRNIPTTDALQTSFNEIKSALDALDPDCGRDEWVAVGMGMHYAGTQTGQLDLALWIWDEWSSRATKKYKGQTETVNQWRSFRTDKHSPVTLGTLFHYAKQRGWERRIDTSGLFSNVPVIDPESLMAAIQPPPPDVNMGLFPKLLAEYAEQMSVGIGCDPLVPLWAGIGAVCGAVDARTRLELMPGYKVPPVLWLMTIGAPADKKSPGSAPMIDTLAALEKEKYAQYERDKMMYDAAEARHKITYKAFLESSVSPEAMLSNNAPILPPPSPVKPSEPRLMEKNMTSQKGVRICADNPGGILYYLDEMGTWLHRVTNPMSGEDRSCWVESYECRPYRMERVGAGTINCEHYALAIFGNVQPAVLRKHVSSMSDDGMIQRFLPVVLRPQYRRRGEPVPAYMTRAADWNQMLRTIHALPPQTYRLSAGAYAAFREFQTWYEAAKGDYVLLGTGGAFQTAFGKLEGTLGRMTLIHHLIDAPFQPEVSRSTMLRCIRLAQSFLIPSLRYALTEVGNKSEFDQWMMDYVIQHAEKPRLRLTEIRNTARHRQLPDRSTWEMETAILAGMYVLEQAGWVVRLDDGSKEHQHAAEWQINPTLQTAFAEHRRRVMKAKRDMRALIIASSTGTLDSYAPEPD